MGLQKGVSNFKEKQEATVYENNLKVEKALESFQQSENTSLSKIIKHVAEVTNLHTTTIKKNSLYLKKCEQKYISILSLSKRIESDNPSLQNELRLCKLENANLRNQIKALSNALSLNSSNSNVEENITSKIDYKKVTEALLEHFKEQIKIEDDKIIDLYSGIREKIIINMKG